jgi:hypothetical protein
VDVGIAVMVADGVVLGDGVLAGGWPVQGVLVATVARVGWGVLAGVSVGVGAAVAAAVVGEGVLASASVGEGATVGGTAVADAALAVVGAAVDTGVISPLGVSVADEAVACCRSGASAVAASGVWVAVSLVGVGVPAVGVGLGCSATSERSTGAGSKIAAGTTPGKPLRPGTPISDRSRAAAASACGFSGGNAITSPGFQGR